MSAPRLIIEGGRPLSGRASVQGSKNVFLHLAASALLMGGVRLVNVPRITDTDVVYAIARMAGAEVARDGGELTVLPGEPMTGLIPPEMGTRIRPTACFAAALLARTGRVVFPLPGGDAFTSRWIDRHLTVMREAGAEVDRSGGAIHARLHAPRPRPFEADIATRRYGPSLGTTVTALLLAVTAAGTSRIRGASIEPEVMHTVSLLRRGGARIRWAGDHTIDVEGVDRLGGAVYEVPPDRMAAGTLALAAAATGGRVELAEVKQDDFPSGFLRHAAAAGVRWSEGAGGLVVERDEEIRPVKLGTAPHPGFPTDLQPQLCVLLTQASGMSVIRERVYEERATHVPGLAAMGACVEAVGHTIAIDGPTPLRGAEVWGADIRAVTALLLGGLVAEGRTALTGLPHLARGYEDLTGALRALGANITEEGTIGLDG